MSLAIALKSSFKVPSISSSIAGSTSSWAPEKKKQKQTQNTANNETREVNKSSRSVHLIIVLILAFEIVFATFYARNIQTTRSATS